MDAVLTRDADKMLCEMYAVYLERRAEGTPKKAAKEFLDPSNWPEKYADRWKSEDGKETLRELKQKGYIRIMILGGFIVEDSVITYMENRFPNGLSNVLEWLGKIKSALPFI